MADEEEDFLNHYEVLGVDETSDKKAITQAYRKLARKYHPDKMVNAEEVKEAEKMFHRINKSYSVLSDDKKREKFDTKIKAKLMKRQREREMDDKRRQMRDDLRKREEEAAAGRRHQFPSNFARRPAADPREERIRRAREANERLTRELVQELEREAAQRVAAEVAAATAAAAKDSAAGDEPPAAKAARRGSPPLLHVGVPDPDVMTHEEYEAATFAAVHAAMQQGHTFIRAGVPAGPGASAQSVT